MRGYCESCQVMVHSETGEFGGDVCPLCHDDVHPGVHVEGDEEGDDFYVDDDIDFDQWLLNG